MPYPLACRDLSNIFTLREQNRIITTNTVLMFTLTFLPTINYQEDMFLNIMFFPHIKCISELNACKINK